MKTIFFFIFLGLFCSKFETVLAETNNVQSDTLTKWMSGKFGLMVHWLPPFFEKPNGEDIGSPIPKNGDYKWDLNDAVNGFNIDKFIADFEKTGAEWLIFTIGQNTGTYASPNSIIDSLSGIGHTPNRDLVLEIAKEIKKRNKKFIAYLPCEIKANTTLHKGFGWETTAGSNQSIFQERYILAVREWSLRFGKNLDGWWFDGCYPTREPFKNVHMKWEKWYQAARAGNEKAIVTFNDGAYLVEHTKPIQPDHDYLSGEALVLVDSKIRLGTKMGGDLFMPEAAYVKGTTCLNHILLPLDGYWAHHGKGFPDWANVPFEYEPSSEKMPDPIYSNSELIKFTQDYCDLGGAITYNVNITQEGFLSAKTIKQLKKIKTKINQ